MWARQCAHYSACDHSFHYVLPNFVVKVDTNVGYRSQERSFVVKNALGVEC